MLFLQFHLYPELPERHGHKYMPSWECLGKFGEHILSKSMSSRVVMENNARSMAKTTDDLLHYWFTARLLQASVFQYLTTDQKSKRKFDDCFTRTEVLRLKEHYKYLVGAVVDKAPSRLLYTCPKFYE